MPEMSLDAGSSGPSGSPLLTAATFTYISTEFTGDSITSSNALIRVLPKAISKVPLEISGKVKIPEVPSTMLPI